MRSIFCITSLTHLFNAGYYVIPFDKEYSTNYTGFDCFRSFKLIQFYETSLNYTRSSQPLVAFFGNKFPLLVLMNTWSLSIEDKLLQWYWILYNICKWYTSESTYEKIFSATMLALIFKFTFMVINLIKPYILQSVIVICSNLSSVLVY